MTASARIALVGLFMDDLAQMTTRKPSPAIGIGYRAAIGQWTRENLECFDVLEITVDHCINAGQYTASAIYNLVGRIPLTAHGIGLSIGTDVPLDLAYLDKVAAIVDRLKAPAYSEHLAFTRTPGRDLANLLPVPKTEAVAEQIIAKVQTVRARISAPFLLENISYMFEWPDSDMSDAEFIKLICRETGAGLLLDVENLYLNSRNHDFDPRAFLDALPESLVQEIHVAGGVTVRKSFLERPFFADTHSHPVPDGALDLLDHVLARQWPATIVIERDDRLDAVDEILEDVARIRTRIANRRPENALAMPLLDRQASLLDYLTSSSAIFGEEGDATLDPALRGIDPRLLRLEACFSHEKRMEKILAVFPKTYRLLGAEQTAIMQEFVKTWPSASVTRIENAQQFYDFLGSRWRLKSPQLPYLQDVAACEFACARVRGDVSAPRDEPTSASRLRRHSIRRHPGVVLLRCAYNIRPVIEDDAQDVAVAKRDTLLAIAVPPGAEHPRVFELPPAVFDVLGALDDWIDRSELEATRELDELFRELAQFGLIEARE